MPANKASQIEHQLSSVQFSSVPSSVGSSEDMTDMNDEFIRDSLPVFSAGGPCEQFWHGQGCPLFDVVHSAFPLPPTLQLGVPKDGFGEAVAACDMPEP